MTDCLRCAGPCKCEETAEIARDDLDFLIQMRSMGARLVGFENEHIHYEAGKGLALKEPARALEE